MISFTLSPRKKIKPLEGQKILFEMTKAPCRPENVPRDTVDALALSGNNNTNSLASDVSVSESSSTRCDRFSINGRKNLPTDLND